MAAAIADDDTVVLAAAAATAAGEAAIADLGPARTCLIEGDDRIFAVIYEGSVEVAEGVYSDLTRIPAVEGGCSRPDPETGDFQVVVHGDSLTVRWRNSNDNIALGTALGHTVNLRGNNCRISG